MAAKAQAEASRAKALELLAEKLPHVRNEQNLIHMLEGLAVRASTPALDREARKEEAQTWNMVENLIKNYHTQALDQAKIQSWFSVIAATIGFLWILFSATTINPEQAGTFFRIVPGTIIDVVAYMFFRQATETRQRATALYDKLRTDNQQSNALALVSSIEDETVRSLVKAQIALHMVGMESSPIDLAHFLSTQNRAPITTLDSQTRGPGDS